MPPQIMLGAVSDHFLGPGRSLIEGGTVRFGEGVPPMRASYAAEKSQQFFSLALPDQTSTSRTDTGFPDDLEMK